MKKLALIALITLAIGTSSFAATANGELKSVTTFNNFYKVKSGVTWKFAENFHKASFEINGTKNEVFFTPEGEYLGITQPFAYNKLPKAALNTIAASYAYPKYALEECIVFKNAENELNYFVSMKKGNKIIVLQINEYGTVSQAQWKI